jgi:hypothetical protein
LETLQAALGGAGLGLAFGVGCTAWLLLLFEEPVAETWVLLVTSLSCFLVSDQVSLARQQGCPVALTYCLPAGAASWACSVSLRLASCWVPDSEVLVEQHLADLPWGRRR